MQIKRDNKNSFRYYKNSCSIYRQYQDGYLGTWFVYLNDDCVLQTCSEIEAKKKFEEKKQYIIELHKLENAKEILDKFRKLYSTPM